MARILVMAVLAAVLLAGVAQACPTCSQAVSQDGTNLTAGYTWSIVFMLSAPFAVFAVVAGYFYHLSRAEDHS